MRTEVLDELRFNIQGKDLALHVDRRVRFYEARADSYDAKRDDDIRRSGSDPEMLQRVQGWETLARNSRARAEFLRFQRDSLVTNVVYRLTDMMLMRLDLTFGQLKIEELPL